MSIRRSPVTPQVIISAASCERLDLARSGSRGSNGSPVGALTRALTMEATKCVPQTGASLAHSDLIEAIAAQVIQRVKEVPLNSRDEPRA